MLGRIGDCNQEYTHVCLAKSLYVEGPEHLQVSLKMSFIHHVSGELDI